MEARPVTIVYLLLAVVGWLFLASLLGRRLRKQRRALGDMASMPDSRLDISEAVHRVPAKVRRAQS
jgi:hypothetical protein